MKRIGALLSLLLVPLIAQGQDTLKVMTYNLLNYQSGVNARDQYYRTVIRHVRPDLLVVQEISASSGSTQQATVDSFYSRVVNVVFPGQFSKGTFVPDPNDTGNEIYYRPSKFTFINNTPIHTELRDISEFKLYNAAAADTFRIYSLHLKAGQGFETNRAAEVDSLRKVTNALPAGKYFIVCGDYNMYGSTELAYSKLLQDNPTDDGHFVDAINLAGTWNTPAYAPYHTQSPRLRAFGGGATGGMDDRFDMILYSRAVSQPGKIRYLAGSLTPIGNDGLHYNDSINHLPNTAVPDSVANALHNASDHLPVSARFVFSGGGGGANITLLTKIVLRDNGGESDSLEFGTGVGATDGIDALFGEYEQPPVPPIGVLDVRWRITGTQGAKRDMRDTLGGTRVQVIYTGQIQAGAGGYPFVLRWNHLELPAGTFMLRDGTGGIVFTVNMKQQDSLLITDSDVQVFQVVYNVGNTVYSNVQQGWNIVSVPVTVNDRRKTTVFPTSTSSAFAYTVVGYVNRDTLDYGKGYWLNFPSPQTVTITGSVRNHDTLFVSTGWNLIGSTSVPVAVTAIQQIPVGIVSSPFFEYLGGYATADSLRSAKGYWVKAIQNGLLILR
jgi:endonuclease/exonuclease/phosphatase family metal-dependent hydrolase